jgi:hypothetical protein
MTSNGMPPISIGEDVAEYGPRENTPDEAAMISLMDKTDRRLDIPAFMRRWKQR